MSEFPEANFNSQTPPPPPPESARPEQAPQPPTTNSIPAMGQPAQGAPNPYGQAGQYPPYQPPYNGYQRHSDGFFSALFDFSFTKFVTISFAKALYVLLLIWVGLCWLIFAIAGVAAFSAPPSTTESGAALCWAFCCSCSWALFPRCSTWSLGEYCWSSWWQTCELRAIRRC